jgi:hypothetical protein
MSFVFFKNVFQNNIKDFKTLIKSLAHLLYSQPYPFYYHIWILAVEVMTCMEFVYHYLKLPVEVPGVQLCDIGCGILWETHFLGYSRNQIYFWETKYPRKLVSQRYPANKFACGRLLRYSSSWILSLQKDNLVAGDFGRLIFLDTYNVVSPQKKLFAGDLWDTNFLGYLVSQKDIWLR